MKFSSRNKSHSTPASLLVWSKLVITTILLLSLVRANDFPFFWVEHQGHKIKKRIISNEKYINMILPHKTSKTITDAKSKAKTNLNINPKIQVSDKVSPVKKKTSKLYLSLNYGVSSLSLVNISNQSKGKVYSESQMGIDLKWRFNKEDTTYFVRTSIDKVSYSQGSTIINNSELNLMSLRSGIHLTKDNSTKAFIQYAQYSFSVIRNQMFSIEKISLPSIGLQYERNLHTVKNWKIDAQVEGQYIFGKDSSLTEINNGLDMSISIIGSKRIEDVDYYISSEFQRRDQDTSTINQTQTGMNISIGLSYDF